MSQAKKISRNGLELLTIWEGFKTRIYNDAAGLPTIGVGHLLTKTELAADAVNIGGKLVRLRYGFTKEQVEALLAQDLWRFEDTVNRSVKVPLTQNQFDALVAFAFNVGEGAFLKSTLLKALVNGNLDAVPDQLRRWTKVDGKEISGLVNRRQNEIDLWLGKT